MQPKVSTVTFHPLELFDTTSPHPSPSTQPGIAHLQCVLFSLNLNSAASSQTDNCWTAILSSGIPVLGCLVLRLV